MGFKRRLKSLIGEDQSKLLSNAYRVLRKDIFYPLRRPDASSKYPIRKFGDPKHHTFFGYYDLSPFDPMESRLLACRVPKKSVANGDQAMSVGYFELSDPGSFKELDMTKAWCWQQACRLQWFPGSGATQVLYNTVTRGKYGGLLKDVRTKQIANHYGRPIYAVSSDGRLGLSVNFSRLQRLRPGYGYGILDDPTRGQSAPSDDGAWIVNLATGASDLVLSLESAAVWNASESMAGAEHYFNHLHFSPGSERFLLFHLWNKNNKRFNRLITCDTDGKNLRQLAVNVSHYCWKSDRELVVFANDPIQGPHYYILTDEDEGQKWLLAERELRMDGHPSLGDGGDVLLTDTYPDEFRRQHLFLYRISASDCVRIGSFGSPLGYYGERRCDLHPRWSPSEKYICFDSAHESARSMYVMTLE